MKTKFGTGLSFFLLAIIFLPKAASAQFASTSNRYSSSTDGFKYWRQQVDVYSQQINSLGSSTELNLNIPVLFGVSLQNLTPNFGDPRDGGARIHEGLDIMALKGTPVVSPTKAVVIKTGNGTSEGNYVYTANPGGETFVYMHLDRIGEGAVTGAVLIPGSLIGYVGNTGNASGGASHLHFEIHDTNGTPINPLPRLVKEFTLQEKISNLINVLNTSTDSSLSQLLVQNFRSTFTLAQQSSIQLPQAISNLLTTVSPTPVQVTTANTIFSRSLTLYSSGEDVKLLQKKLNQLGFIISPNGVGSPGNETTYFGLLTQKALIKYQLSRNISPAIGFFGQITRSSMSQ